MSNSTSGYYTYIITQISQVLPPHAQLPHTRRNMPAVTRLPQHACRHTPAATCLPSHACYYALDDTRTLLFIKTIISSLAPQELSSPTGMDSYMNPGIRWFSRKSAEKSSYDFLEFGIHVGIAREKVPT